MNQLISIPDELTEARTALVRQARELQITDQPSYEYAVTSHNQAHELEKRIIAHYEPMREAAKAAYDAVLEAKKRDLDPVAEVKKILSRSIASFEVEQERERQREQARQDDEALKAAEEKRKQEVAELKKAGASKEEIKEVKSAPVTAISPEIQPTFQRSASVSKPIEKWSAEVQGAAGFLALVKAVAKGEQPVSLLEPNMVALNGMARSLKDTMNIPGVKAVCEHIASARRAG